MLSDGIQDAWMTLSGLSPNVLHSFGHAFLQLVLI